MSCYIPSDVVNRLSRNSLRIRKDNKRENYLITYIILKDVSLC